MLNDKINIIFVIYKKNFRGWKVIRAQNLKLPNWPGDFIEIKAFQINTRLIFLIFQF